MANKKSKVDLSRININIPTELKDKVHEYAHKLGINYTAAFIVLLNNGLNNNALLEKLPRVLGLYSNFNNEDSILFDRTLKDKVEKLKNNDGIDLTEDYNNALDDALDFLNSTSSDNDSND